MADYLVSKGMPFRRAHEVVGGIVRDLASKGADFSSLSPADWKAYDALFDEDVEQWLSPEAAVRNRRTPQSTNPDAVKARIAEARARLSVR